VCLQLARNAAAWSSDQAGVTVVVGNTSSATAAAQTTTPPPPSSTVVWDGTEWVESSPTFWWDLIRQVRTLGARVYLPGGSEVLVCRLPEDQQAATMTPCYFGFLGSALGEAFSLAQTQAALCRHKSVEIAAKLEVLTLLNVGKMVRARIGGLLPAVLADAALALAIAATPGEWLPPARATFLAGYHNQHFSVTFLLTDNVRQHGLAESPEWLLLTRCFSLQSRGSTPTIAAMRTFGADFVSRAADHVFTSNFHAATHSLELVPGGEAVVDLGERATQMLNGTGYGLADIVTCCKTPTCSSDPAHVEDGLCGPCHVKKRWNITRCKTPTCSSDPARVEDGLCGPCHVKKRWNITRCKAQGCSRDPAHVEDGLCGPCHVKKHRNITYCEAHGCSRNPVTAAGLCKPCHVKKHRNITCCEAQGCSRDPERVADGLCGRCHRDSKRRPRNSGGVCPCGVHIAQSERRCTKHNGETKVWIKHDRVVDTTKWRKEGRRWTNCDTGEWQRMTPTQDQPCWRNVASNETYQSENGNLPKRIKNLGKISSWDLHKTTDGRLVMRNRVTGELELLDNDSDNADGTDDDDSDDSESTDYTDDDTDGDTDDDDDDDDDDSDDSGDSDDDSDDSDSTDNDDEKGGNFGGGGGKRPPSGSSAPSPATKKQKLASAEDGFMCKME